MLVKVGDIWVDPEEVVGLDKYATDGTLLYMHGALNEPLAAAISRDEAAEIINRALEVNVAAIQAQLRGDPEYMAQTPRAQDGDDLPPAPPPLSSNTLDALRAAVDYGYNWAVCSVTGAARLFENLPELSGGPSSNLGCWTVSAGKVNTGNRLDELTGYADLVGRPLPLAWLLGEGQ